MAYEWQPGTFYGPGDEVVYEGGTYTVVQPHTSEPGWQPPNTPALWARKHEQYGDEKHPYNNDAAQQHGGQHHEEQNRFERFGDVMNQHKLEIGGGLLAGAAVIGAGVWAYSRHNHEEEEAKKKAWRENNSNDNYVQGAQARTEYYQQPSVQKPPARWVLVEGRNFPHDAIPLGRDGGGESLFAVRAYRDGTVQLGKAGAHLYPAPAVISYRGQEVGINDRYEVLVGARGSVCWIDVQPNGRNNGDLVSGWTPVEGGRDEQGNFIFVALVNQNGAEHPGAAEADENFASIAWGGGVIRADRQYKLLAYA